MKLDSLIDTIKRSIATGASSNVSIHDKSFFYYLLYSHRDRPGGERSTPTPGLKAWRRMLRRRLTLRPGDRFPATMCAIRGAELLLAIPLGLFYLIIFGAGRVMGMRHSLRDITRSPRVNFVLMCTVLVSLVLAVFLMFMFFTGDVLFYRPARDINQAGALSIKQPAMREHNLLLVNTATPWIDTGVDLMEGDVVTITASGGYHGAIYDKYYSAKVNKNTTYRFINMSYPDDESGDAGTCIYNGDDARFGSLIYQIQSDSAACIYSNRPGVPPVIHQAKCNTNGVLSETFTVGNPGTLFVSVNDMYLDEATVARLEAADSVLQQNGADSLRLKYYSDLRRLTVADPTNWIADNCGDMLLNIVVERSIWGEPSLSMSDKIMHSTYRTIDHASLVGPGFWLRWLIIIGALTLWLLFDHFVSPRIINKD